MFSTFPSTFAGIPVDIRHRHLQTSESTSVHPLTLEWLQFPPLIPSLIIPKPPTLDHNIPRVLFHRPRPLGGDSPPQSWARGVDSYIAARHGRLWLTSSSPLPSPRTAETSHLSFHPHNTLACNHSPPHTHSLHTACQRT